MVTWRGRAFGLALLLGLAVTLAAAAAAEDMKPQTTCPVRGGKINKAFFADVEGKRVYVCCRGCLAPLKAAPAKYLKILADKGETPEAAPDMLDAGDAMPPKMQTSCAVCPVAGHKINKQCCVDVAGKRVYTCGDACLAKAKADPRKYLEVVTERGETAEAVETPSVNTATLALLLRARVPMTILDARTGKYDDGRRLPGATSLSAMSTAEEVAGVLPDKGALIVTYCANLKCPASAMLAGHLRKLGYKNVIEYPSGMEGWTAAGLSTDKAGEAR